MADSTKNGFNPAKNLDDEARKKGGEMSPRNFKNMKKENPGELKRIAKKGGEA